ncbi:hypothetical protein GGI23_002943 [Coemansia sp. RSA 2559]|nr:hypothetical protein GGI23_002943 [Coemansia sp. RSA 2559]
MVRRSGPSVDSGADAMGRPADEPSSAIPRSRQQQQQPQEQQGASAASMPEVELDRFQRQFQSELDQLEEMGFIDKNKNLKALIATNGDLNLAINIIAGEDD